MKIFNWINLKLHPSCTNYSQVPREKDTVLDHGADVDEGQAAAIRKEKKLSAEPATAELTEKETKALLLHDMLNGILTIGTLGHRHPLLLHSTYIAAAPAHEEQSTDPEDDQPTAIKNLEEKQEDADDGVPPSMEKKAAATMAMATTGDQFKIVRDDRELMLIAAAAAVDSSEIEKILELPLLTDQDEKSGQIRTTLADLFAADASFDSRKSKEMMINLRGNYMNCSNCNRESKSHQKIKKERQILSKKNLDISAEKSTRKKLQKLITRMLKKKIHPEMPAAGTAKEAAKSSRGGGVAGREVSHGLACSIWYTSSLFSLIQL